jgi:hypothetical protein
LRRYHNKSTYETVIDHYQVKDRKLAYIGRIMHDIEVNVWEKKAMPETSQAEVAVQRMIERGETAAIVEGCLRYFDQLYRQVEHPAAPHS